MVTLKNTGGVELDKDGIMTNLQNSEVSQTDSGTGDRGGHAKAVLIPGKTSHPFQERTLTLDQTVKIGRSVARTRPSATNGIFDCKVLSRNHAIIWYDNKKFYIQDTKSSNGTFVNNHRLSKGSEDSVPREIYSGDVVQFGVDVLENQRKGNEDTENSDESNHIVTHGCIVATVRLYYPNGKEADSSQLCNVSKALSDMPPEEICKLQMILYEAQQREVRLHDKLEELQFIVGKLEVACQDALTNRFEETRLLSKIENLEKQTRVMKKIRQGSVDKTVEKAEMEIHQLLLDVEKVQYVSREIQELQHRKLLETEQKLAKAQTVASNLQLEVFALREHASRSETHIQELASKCTAFSQTIDLLKTNLTAQMEANQDLEARLAEIQQREADFRMDFYKQSKLKKLGLDKGKLITDDSDDDVPEKVKENEDVVLEWISKYYNETGGFYQKDCINEDDRTESLKRQIDTLRDALYNGLQNISTCLGQLEVARVEFEKSRDDVEKCLLRKKELKLQLESKRLLSDENEKTENDVFGEKEETGKSIISSVNNEKIFELESELKEQEELLIDAQEKNKDSERKYNKLKCELDAAKFRCEILNLETCGLRKTLQNRYGCLDLPSDLIIEKMGRKNSEKENLSLNEDETKSGLKEGIKDVIMDNKECQTMAVILKTTETNTTSSLGGELDTLQEELKIVRELNGTSNKITEDETHTLIATSYPNMSETKSDCLSSQSAFSDLDVLPGKRKDESEPASETIDSKTKTGNDEMDSLSNNLGIWEKIERIHGLSDELSSDSSLFNCQVKEIRSLLNLVAEDLVRLLMHEQQMNKDNQGLQERLDKSMIQTDITALGLTNQFVVFIIGILLYCLGGRALEFMGFSR